MQSNNKLFNIINQIFAKIIKNPDPESTFTSFIFFPWFLSSFFKNLLHTVQIFVWTYNLCKTVIFLAAVAES